jgi:hypothetical protein
MEYILSCTFAYNAMRLGQKARSVGSMHKLLTTGYKVTGMGIVPVCAPLKLQRRVQYMFDPHCRGYTDYQQLFKTLHA